jgi:hypothetical protein
MEAIRRIELRALDPMGFTSWLADQWNPMHSGKTSGNWRVSGNRLEWRLPRKALGDASVVFVSAALLKGRKELDRTAWTIWSLNGAAQRTPPYARTARRLR